MPCIGILWTTGEELRDIDREAEYILCLPMGAFGLLSENFIGSGLLGRGGLLAAGDPDANFCFRVSDIAPLLALEVPGLNGALTCWDVRLRPVGGEILEGGGDTALPLPGESFANLCFNSLPTGEDLLKGDSSGDIMLLLSVFLPETFDPVDFEFLGLASLAESGGGGGGGGCLEPGGKLEPGAPLDMMNEFLNYFTVLW